MIGDPSAYTVTSIGPAPGVVGLTGKLPLYVPDASDQENDTGSVGNAANPGERLIVLGNVISSTEEATTDDGLDARASASG